MLLKIHNNQPEFFYLLDLVRKAATLPFELLNRTWFGVGVNRSKGTCFAIHGRIHMFMPKKKPLLRLAWSSAVALSSLAAFSPATASQGIFLPSGLMITPTAAPQSTYEALNPELPEFPNFIAGGALSTAKSPDGKILLVLTGGHNNLTDTNGKSFNNEYIFVFDISGGKPVKNLPGVTGGIDLTQDGQTLVVANYNNESISFIDVQSRSVVKELDLRPGKNNSADSGKPGGEYPFWVTVKGNNTAYVSSARDREIVVVDFTTIAAPKIVTRIEVSATRLRRSWTRHRAISTSPRTTAIWSTSSLQVTMNCSRALSRVRRMSSNSTRS